MIVPVAAAAPPALFGPPQTAFNATLGATSLTLALPNGGSQTSAPTIYIVQVGDHSGAPTLNTPTGFTQLCAVSPDSVDEEQTFYQTFPAGSVPPASITLTNPNAWNWAGAIAVAYQGFNTAHPFDGGCATSSVAGQTTSIVGPSVTTTTAEDLVVWNFFVNLDVGTNPVAVSQGTVEAEVTRAQAAGDMYLNYTDLYLAAPGSSGTDTLSWSQSYDGAGPAAAIAFALEPAGGYNAPPEDAYGGLLSVPCTNSNTTFSIALVGTAGKPVLCTPAGHALFGRAVESMDPGSNGGSSVEDEYGKNYESYVTSKFGSINPTWYTESLKQITDYYGFNMVGAMSNSYLLPVTGQSYKVPFIWYDPISSYTMNSYGTSWGTGNAKPIFHLLDRTGWGGYKSDNNELADYFDPNWSNFASAIFKHDQTALDLQSDTADRGYVVGFMVDDSDNLHCFGAGPDNPTVPTENNDFRCGMVGLFVPAQDWATTFNGGTLYPDPTVYWKKQFQSNLQTEYGSIGALNTAWGSQYTTFGSSGTCVGASLTVACASSAPADTLGSGDGATLTFQGTTTHGNISPFSLGIFVAGTLAAGDDGAGNIIGTHVQSGTVDYSTGTTSITFDSGYAPPQGASVTAEYISGGWEQAGTGFMDEDCRSSHASYCGDGSKHSVEFYACTSGCILPSAGVQADVNSFTQSIAAHYSSTIKQALEAWAASNGFSGPILFLGPSSAGTWSAPSDAYVLRGFKGNVDVYPYGGVAPFTQAELDYVQQNMGNVPLIWNVYKPSNADSELAWPGSTCSHSGTTITCDLVFPSGATNQIFTTSSQINTTCNYTDYQVTNVEPSAVGAIANGSAPITYTGSSTPMEASATCNVYFSDTIDDGYPSETARGQAYYNDASNLVASAFSDGYRPYIALQWWGLFTDNGEKRNWGWQTTRGNSYDGGENVASQVSCHTPLNSYVCGSERNPSGDMVSYGQETHAALDAAVAALMN